MKQILYPVFISICLIIAVFLFFEELENYFTDLLMSAESQPARYALISLTVLASDIILPVPSSIVMYYNGLILGFIQGTLLSLFSLFISGTVGYWIGYTSAFGLNQEKNEKATQIIARFGSMGMILTRGVPILSESVCITAGYNRMSFRHYTILNVAGALPLSLVYGYFGAIGKDNNLFYYSFGLSLLVSLVFFLAGKRLLEKNNQNEATTG